MKAVWPIAFSIAPVSALAHGGAPDGSTNAAVWTYDPWVLLPLFVSAVLYLMGTWRLWRAAGYGRGIRYRQVVAFWTGWACLTVALVSPLHWLGERLFTAHMIEHEIVMVVAAPLLALSRPIGAFLWALPQSWRRALGKAAQQPSVAAAWRVVSDPLTATLLQGIALWAWHMPVLYNAVLASDGMHRLQHVTFLITSLLFWWSLFYGRSRHRGYGPAVLYLFVTSLNSAALGIVLTLSRSVWYPRQAASAAQWGLTPLEDQQLAGLIMWVPSGLLYTAAALWFAAQWIASSTSSRRSGSGFQPPAHASKDRCAVVK